MAHKVVFPENATSITVAGLYQWDYGQVLEIECHDIGSEIVEVHFACHNMSEAIVRPCTFANGIGTVIIPDRCLEQTSAITAWIYRVDGTGGHTIKTITLPLTPRTRPGKTRDIPAETVDKYGELIEQVNVAVEALEAGTITAANALNAKTAESATTAQNAVSASYATSAGSSTIAGSATYASSVLVSPDYCFIEITDGGGTTDINFAAGLYFVAYSDSYGKTVLSGVGYIGANEGSLNTYIVPLGTGILYYDEYGSDSTASGAGAEVSVISSSEYGLSIPSSGTLIFARIGEISHG